MFVYAAGAMFGIVPNAIALTKNICFCSVINKNDDEDEVVVVVVVLPSYSDVGCTTCTCR